MAFKFFEDKRKTPVNIYKKGSKTEKIQRKQFKAVTDIAKAATEGADKYLGGAGARKIGRGIEAIVAPVIAGREHHKRELFKKLPFQPPGYTQEGIGPYDDPVYRNSSKFLKATDLSGKKKKKNSSLGNLQKSFEKHIRNIPRQYQRGNLDITFDNSVNQDSRDAFLQDPVRPTAQIDRFRRGRVQGKLFRPDYNWNKSKEKPDTNRSIREQKVTRLQNKGALEQLREKLKSPLAMAQVAELERDGELAPLLQSLLRKRVKGIDSFYDIDDEEEYTQSRYKSMFGNFFNE